MVVNISPSSVGGKIKAIASKSAAHRILICAAFAKGESRIRCEELNRDNILAWLGDKNKIYRFHERYSLLLGRLAREYGCRLIDLRAAFLEQWDVRPYYCRDGIHPNASGQKLLGESILAAI